MKSFIYSRKSDKIPACSVFSYVRGRREPKSNSVTWANQTIPVEVVVAEFGPYPDIFADHESLNHIDKYIFCYQPNDSPFAACWWRNVAAYQCSCLHALQIDCDIAISRTAAETMLDIAHANPNAFIHPKEISKSSMRNIVDYESLKRDVVASNCEAVWMYDMNIYKARGGWPESYTGKDSEILPFKRIMAGIPFVETDMATHFCHVDHLFTENRSKWTPHSVPLMPWLPTFTTWPLPSWQPGRIDLCEDKK